MSDLGLWRFSGPAKACVVALVLCPSACSDAGEPAADAPLPSQSVGIEPLTEAELMGIPRSAVVLTVPWSRSPVSRDPAPAAPRATLHSVEFSGGEGFDRATFELGADTPFPGYRIVWNEVATSVCGEETPPTLVQRRRCWSSSSPRPLGRRAAARPSLSRLAPRACRPSQPPGNSATTRTTSSGR